MAAALRIVPVTPARWPDVVTLFGPRGACAGCWCMWARRPAAEYRAGLGDGNRRALRRRIEAGPPPGVLAYDGTTPVGWAAVAPRSEYARLAGSRVLAPVDSKLVWSVPCFFVAKTHRRRGLTVRLLRAACALAASRGARIVEGYPLDLSKPMAAAFAWTGLAPTFRAAGFREVLRRSPTRPIFRRAVRPRRRAAARG